MNLLQRFRRTGVSNALHLAKAVGLFALARKMTANRLRILCYHGVSLRNEHEWRPPLYMTRAQFAERLDHLTAAGFPVLTLDDAVEKLTTATLPPGATVITFDDGFKDFHRLAHPELARRRFPSTLYVTTYHAQKRTPVFRLMVDYMFWLSPVSEIDLTELSALPPAFFATSPRRLSLLDEQHAEVIWRLVRYAETHLSENARVLLCRQLGHALGVDYDALKEAGLFGIVDEDEMRSMAEDNVTIQLHTHRHVLPNEADGVRREIEDNRRVLEPIAGPQRHFCYPSGVWSPAQLPMLRANGVVSATTCDIGMNRPEQDPLTLRRFLDGHQVTQIRFEAEMSGLIDLMRDAKGVVRTIIARLQGVVSDRISETLNQRAA